MSKIDLALHASAALLLLALAFVGYKAIQSLDYRDKLMQQCLASGKQEYECYSMLRSNSSAPVPIPIMIPMR